MQKAKSDPQIVDYPVNAFKRQKRQQLCQSDQQGQKRQMEKRFYYKQQQPSNKCSEDKYIQDIRQDAAQSQQQEQEQLEKQAQDIVNELRKKQQKNKANNKVVVGTGFSFDITQFFKFEKKKKLDSKDGDLFSEISGSLLAWFILLYSVLNSAMIPSWIMNIKATKFLRISWRFMMQSLMIFPFVLYERRVGNEQVKQQYTISHIIKPVHLKKVYLSSIATSIWFSCILTVFEWTYISHGLVLGSLSNFFLSIYRSMTGQQHILEPGGRYCVVLGILLVIYDSYSLVPQNATDYQNDVINPFYLTREWYQRVLADLVALFVSFTMSKISRYTSDMENYYPPYLSMLLVNIFMTINMIFSTYFFNGLTFDNDPQFGYFSIFTQQHFAGFLYMSIVLCFGMFVSFVLISKLFQDPILPALAMTLDPILGTMLLEWFGVQTMPKAYSFIGYLLIVPGLLLILVGQCFYQRSQSKQAESLQKQRAIQILKQLKQLKMLKSIQQKRTKLIRAKTMKRDMQAQMKSQRCMQNISQGKQSSKNSLHQPLIYPEYEVVHMARKTSFDNYQLNYQNKDK